MFRKIEIFFCILLAAIWIQAQNTHQKPGSPSQTSNTKANPLITDEQAKDAVLALKKLQARTEIGISQDDYSRALGDAYFSVRLFLDSDSAASVPEFSKALNSAIKWYRAAAELWKIKTDTQEVAESVPGLKPDGADCDQQLGGDENLCVKYPELISDRSGKRGINYEGAINEAWRLASTEVRIADKLLK
ncbi:MAG: hypothetical protein ABSA42_14030 [Terracidiphilus sp.]|jgi:hypothetical protein